MNITLIGMAGAGKSSIGKELAKKLKYSFVDTDRIIEKDTDLKLQAIIDAQGEAEFLKIEEKTILSLENSKNSVISPGGSVVYSLKAMQFLKTISKIVFLNSRFEDLKKRLKNTETRGIIGLKNKSLRQLFNERANLYGKYADITIEFSNINSKKIAEEIMQSLGYATHASMFFS